ncbi:hypothetical protein L9F63_002696, partial [Diploptera punctata]
TIRLLLLRFVLVDPESNSEVDVNLILFKLDVYPPSPCHRERQVVKTFHEPIQYSYLRGTSFHQLLNNYYHALE